MSALTETGTILFLIGFLFLLIQNIRLMKNENNEAYRKNDAILTIYQLIMILFIFSANGFNLLKNNTNYLTNGLFIISIISLIVSIIINIKIKLIDKNESSVKLHFFSIITILLFGILSLAFIFTTLKI